MDQNNETDEVIVCASYSEVNNSYQTTSTTIVSNNKGNQAKTSETNIDISAQPSRKRGFNDGTSQLQQNKALSISKLIASSGKNTECLSSCLLSAALVASILNTFLLAFVIKSIQLNNEGLVDGKVSWDERTQSTMFEPFTRLFGKSISVKSIESLDGGRPLRLELWPPNQANLNQIVPFLGSLSDDQNGESASEKRQSNHLAADYTLMTNVLNGQRDESRAKLKVGTKLLVLNLLYHSNSTKPTNKADNVKTYSKKLLEFNDEQESITLPIESKLNLSPQLAGSITCRDRLKSSQIFGSLEEDLNVQTRDGNLACHSEKSMKLISKAGNLKMTTVEGLNLEVEQLRLGSSQLYLSGKGLRYIDSDEQEVAPHLDDRREESLIQSSARHPVSSLKPLKGYDLVAIDNLLLAAG